jgi:hypothetical protein
MLSSKRSISIFNRPFMWSLALLAVLLAAVVVTPALAQSGFSLNVRRNFGFSSGGLIRGNFNLEVVNGPSDLASVTFLIDGKPIKTVNQPPFSMTLVTTDYPDGVHELSATGTTASGQTLTTPTRQFTFASAAQQGSAIGKILPLLIGIVVVAIALNFGLQALTGRRKTGETIPLGAPRDYGLTGGAICPRCGRPFARHWWALNMVTGKLDRCPNCGRFGIYRRASREELSAAEQAEVKAAQPAEPVHELSEEEKLRQQIEKSKYTDK